MRSGVRTICACGIGAGMLLQGGCITASNAHYDQLLTSTVAPSARPHADIAIAFGLRADVNTPLTVAAAAESSHAPGE